MTTTETMPADVVECLNEWDLDLDTYGCTHCWGTGVVPCSFERRFCTKCEAGEIAYQEESGDNPGWDAEV